MAGSRETLGTRTAAAGNGFFLYTNIIMNKSDLINAMATEGGMSKVVAKNALDAFIAAVTKAMKEGEKVSLVGFGTFSVSERSARTGINPATKQAIEIPAKKVVKFKPGAELMVD